MKIYAFVDAQNLHLSIKQLGWEIDYKKFFVYLKERQKADKIFLFIGFQKENQWLYSFLIQIGYTIVFKPTVVGKDGKIKGNCDGELILHTAAIEFHYYDRAIIISGDGDFHCLIEFLEEREKLYKIGVPNEKNYSLLLKKWRSDNTMFFISRLERYIKKEL